MNVLDPAQFQANLCRIWVYGVYSLLLFSLVVLNIIGVDHVTGSILERVRQFDEEQAWLRQFVIPEEDRHRFTLMPWRGEYRWFQSPNVICLEKARAARSGRGTDERSA